ncbi:MAG TPA: polyprenyl synthetase family protein [Acetobacteraceae bacterium]
MRPILADGSACGKAAQMRALQDGVNRRLEALLPAGRDPSHPLHSSMRYALMAPGKRIRPLLTILSTSVLGADDAAALDAGCALEMVHTASLILDDLPSMDDARLRRGQKAAHLVFGEDVAILAAISLLSRAFGVLASVRHLPGAVRAELVEILSEATGACGLSGGQVDDLREAFCARPAERIAAVNHLKTGMLFLAAVEMAASIARVGEGERAALRRFAENLGWAFQLRDDLLDEDGVPAVTGKDAGQDRGKSTLVATLGRDGAALRLRGHLAEALESLVVLGAQEHQLHALVRVTFGAEAAWS